MRASEPNVSRVVHCAGGVKALSNPDDVALVGPNAKGQAAEVEIDAYPNLIRTLRQLGLTPLGCQFFRTHDQIAGLREPDWRAIYQPLRNHRWPAFDVQQKWSQITHAASNANGMGVFWDGRKIAAQITISSKRLLCLSMAYQKHLFVLVDSGNFKPGSAMDGRFSGDVFLEAHAMMGDLVTLQDYLAQFVSRQISSPPAPSLDAMPKLVNSVASLNIEDKLKTTLVEARTWLKDCSDLRNLIVHNSPLGEATGKFGLKQIEINTSLGNLAGLQLRLPGEPAQLLRKLRAAETHESYDEWAAAALEERTGQDVLSYCHAQLGRLVDLADVIADYSGFEPKVPTIKAKNVKISPE